MLRVVADTNIYISALNFGGVPELFLNLAEAGAFQLVSSASILQEVAETLRSEKFAWPEPAIEDAAQQLARIAECVKPVQKLDVIKSDPDDNRILECAEAGQADYIVTGDKRHLLPLRHYGEAQILKLAEFMEQVLGEAEQK